MMLRKAVKLDYDRVFPEKGSKFIVPIDNFLSMFPWLDLKADNLNTFNHWYWFVKEPL